MVLWAVCGGIFSWRALEWEIRRGTALRASCDEPLKWIRGCPLSHWSRNIEPPVQVTIRGKYRICFYKCCCIPKMVPRFFWSLFLFIAMHRLLRYSILRHKTGIMLFPLYKCTLCIHVVRYIVPLLEALSTATLNFWREEQIWLWSGLLCTADQTTSSAKRQNDENRNCINASHWL